MPSKVFLIQSEGLGRGDDKLGTLLMANFLRLLGENKDKPSTLVFWNDGVRLACRLLCTRVSYVACWGHRAVARQRLSRLLTGF